MFSKNVLFAAVAIVSMNGLEHEAFAGSSYSQLQARANTACEAALSSGSLTALRKVQRRYRRFDTACTARASTEPALTTQEYFLQRNGGRLFSRDRRASGMNDDQGSTPGTGGTVGVTTGSSASAEGQSFNGDDSGTGASVGVSAGGTVGAGTGGTVGASAGGSVGVGAGGSVGGGTGSMAGGGSGAGHEHSGHHGNGYGGTHGGGNGYGNSNGHGNSAGGGNHSDGNNGAGHGKGNS